MRRVSAYRKRVGGLVVSCNKNVIFVYRQNEEVLYLLENDFWIKIQYNMMSWCQKCLSVENEDGELNLEKIDRHLNAGVEHG